MNANNLVAMLFDDMADSYDDINDLWYSWLFSRLHHSLAEFCRSNVRPNNLVLDVGCGTGFQTYLFSKFGCRVHGVDIAEQLVARARDKARSFNLDTKLFLSHFSFVDKYDLMIDKLARASNSENIWIEPIFSVQDITSLSFDSASFDHVNCCGSVLSFVDNYELALNEIHRVLRTGGTFSLEVESRYNFDLVWSLLDYLTFGALGYESTLKESIQLLFNSFDKPVKIQYPFGDVGEAVEMPINLFTTRHLIGLMRAIGMEVCCVKNIHSITNLIPSTLLDSKKTSGFVDSLFKILSLLESRDKFNFPGCSVVFFGKKLT